MSSTLRPDGFAIGLFLFGLVMLFVPLMVMPSVIAMLSAIAYWLTTMVVKSAHRRRS
jgi:hypothetical protein